jgi:predicted acyltransferase
MSETLLAKKSERLLSLDVFRGMTIAGMILVNHPGSWGKVWKPLGHAPWNGWTPTDLIFPFFLFIVGVAMTFSFDKRMAKGQSRLRLFEHVVRRAVILICLGLTMYALPDVRLAAPYIILIIALSFLYADEPPFGWGQTQGAQIRKVLGWALLAIAIAYFFVDFGHFDEKKLRVPGVLQRIGLVYFLASIIVLTCGLKGRIAWAAGLTLFYWVLIKLSPTSFEGVELPAERVAHSINEWIDIKLLGAHLYSERPDPEGLLSSLPAVATTLCGVLTGMWLLSSRDRWEKAAGLFFGGAVAMTFALVFIDPCFPINKKIWSSSYVIFMAGLSLQFLGFCYVLIDIKGYKKWSQPFMVFGTNAILVFFAAHLCSKMMGRIRWELADGSITSLKGWIYSNFFLSWMSEWNASLAYAIIYTSLWLLILIPLYRKKIFLKI